MDYATGDSLIYIQWTSLHDLAKIDPFQDDGDGAAISLNAISDTANASGIVFNTGIITCLTPAGKPYTLPANVEVLDFTIEFDYVPDGALVAFRIGNETYVSVFNSKTKDFLGYSKIINSLATTTKDRIEFEDVEKTKPKCLTDNVTKTLQSDSRVLVGKVANCEIHLYQVNFSEVTNKEGINDANYKGSGATTGVTLSYNFEGQTPIAVSDPTACLNKYAKAFYDGHLTASGETKEILLRIANLLNSIEGGGDALFADYLKYCYKAGSQKYYGNTDMWGPDGYVLFEKALIAYSKQQKDLELEILSLAATKDNRNKLTDLGWMLVNKYSESISIEVCLHLLKALSTDFMWGNAFFGDGQEFLALKLLNGLTTKEKQASLLAAITNDGLLETLYQRMGDEGGSNNFTTFIMLLSKFAKNNMDVFGIQGAPAFVWVGNLFRSDKVKLNFLPSGQMNLQGFQKIYTCYSSYYGETTCIVTWKETTAEYTLSPFTFIPVKLPRGLDFLDPIDKGSGDLSFVPLIYLKALNTKRTVDVTKTTAGILIDAASLFVGVGELNVAIKAIQNGANVVKCLRAIAMATDVVVTSGDIVVTLVKDEIKTVPGGKDFLDAYNTFSAFIGLLTFGADEITKESPEVLFNLSDSWRNFKNINATNPKALINAVGSKKGYDEIENIVNGTENALTNSGQSISTVNGFNTKYADAIANIASDWKVNALGKEINNLTEAPLGYQFYELDGNKWIRRIDASDSNTPQLTVRDGIVVMKYPYSDNLTGVIKNTFNQIVAAGLKYIDDGTSISILNTDGSEIAKIINGKFEVSKWGAHYEGIKANEVVLDNGYWLIDNGSVRSIDIGFKERKGLKAEEVNDYLIKGQGKDADGQPYLLRTFVDELSLEDKDGIIYIVEVYNGGVPKPGQYGSKEPISTIKELREKLAVKEAWKEDAKEPTLRAYRVKPGVKLRVRSGTIGPQIENGITLPGGGHQYEIIDYLDNNEWRKYLDINGLEEGIKLIF